ncbi:hypothetical protein BJ878DRAFT_240327 [Calycina marina]|uniref:Uncharacterized protein n=1 Tax=Calycina marina TaxID=1763456 RepID=A0A9P7YWY5_9HELO|nr:hypothetical protein BJ878DRAFT_240327 [Calycina marina]
MKLHVDHRDNLFPVTTTPDVFKVYRDSRGTAIAACSSLRMYENEETRRCQLYFQPILTIIHLRLVYTVFRRHFPFRHEKYVLAMLKDALSANDREKIARLALVPISLTKAIVYTLCSWAHLAGDVCYQAVPSSTKQDFSNLKTFCAVGLPYLIQGTTATTRGNYNESNRRFVGEVIGAVKNKSPSLSDALTVGFVVVSDFCEY